MNMDWWQRLVASNPICITRATSLSRILYSVRINLASIHHAHIYMLGVYQALPVLHAYPHMRPSLRMILSVQR